MKCYLTILAPLFYLNYGNLQEIGNHLTTSKTLTPVFLYILFKESL